MFKYLNTLFHLLLSLAGFILFSSSGTAKDIQSDTSFTEKCAFHHSHSFYSESSCDLIKKGSSDQHKSLPLTHEDFILELGEKEKEKEKEEDRKLENQLDGPSLFLLQDHHSYQFLSDHYCRIDQYVPKEYPIIAQRKYLFFEVFLV